METIIGACITGIVTIIGAVIVYQVKLAKIFDNTEHIKSKCSKLSGQNQILSGEHNNLLVEHNNLSGEHKGLSSDHRQLLSIGSDIKITVADIGKIVSDEKTKQEFRYNNLTDKQKDISQSIAAIELMHSEMKRLQSEHVSLHNHIEELKKENRNLRITLENERMHKKNQSTSNDIYTHEFDDEDELER